MFVKLLSLVKDAVRCEWRNLGQRCRQSPHVSVFVGDISRLLTLCRSHDAKCVCVCVCCSKVLIIIVGMTW